MRAGRLDTALQIASAGANQAAQANDTRWYWQLQLLKVDVLLLRHDVNGARSILDQRLPESEAAESGAVKRMLEGRLLLATGQLSAAGNALDDALREAARSHQPDVLSETEILRGRLCRSQGNFPGAETHYRAALRIAATRHDSYRQAAALSNLGYLRIHQSRYDEALDFLRRALPFAEDAQARPLKAVVLSNIAVCETRFGEFERAVAAQEQAIEMQKQAGIPLPIVNALSDLGAIRLFENRPDAALDYFRKAAALATEIGAQEQAASIKADAARALLELARVDEADRENREAAAIQAKLTGPTPVPEFQLNAAEIACARGDCQQAVGRLTALLRAGTPKGAITWRTHAALARAHAALGSRREARRQFDTALAQIEEARAELARTEYKLGFLRHLMRFYRNYVNYLVREGDDARALEVVDSSRAQLFAERAGSGNSPAAATQLTDLRRRARDAGAVLLSYWLAPEKSQLWVVSAHGVQRFELPGEAHIARLVQIYREGIEGRLRDPLATAPDTGIELYRTLIAPARTLIGSTPQVVIAADGVLHNLNFETLIVPDPAPHYWIEDVTISVTPALRLLEPNGAPAARSMLAFGDAEPVNSQYPRLPSAHTELDAIRSSFERARVIVRRGRDATPAAWQRSQPEQFSMIHFAAHAVANRESPLDSAIILSRENGGYKLYTRDIAAANLRADLVTVSACRSAGARAFSGEGLVGFAWAFLHAGARSVIAGLWDVSDRQTAELMSNLYQSLARNQSPPAALRAAKLRFIHAGGNSRKPYNWAAFQLYTRQLNSISNASPSLKRSSS
jgi:CHAT domain-containing protein/Tfp pilus assembly protein PilF